MAFTVINNAEIVAGKPTKQELFQKTKDNFDDHESRITTVEGATAAFRPIEFNAWGEFWRFNPPLTAVMYERINFNITALSVRLIIIEAGTAGTTEIDLLYGPAGGPFVSIFSTKPSVGFAAGDLAISTNGVLSTTALVAGNFLRFDISSAQTNSNSIMVQLEYEKT